MFFDLLLERLPYIIVAAGNIMIAIGMWQWKKEVKKLNSGRTTERERAQTLKRLLFFFGSVAMVVGWFWKIAG